VQKWLVYRLKTVPREDRDLQETLDRFNKACAFIAEYANEHRTYSLEKLRKHAQQGVLLNKRVQNKFGLHSGITEAAIRRVLDDYAQCNPKCPRGSRREVVPEYGDNAWILCTASTASVVMETIHPAHLSPAPFRASLATYKKKKGRLRVPFRRELGNVPVGEDWKKNRVVLVSTPDSETNWTLIANVEIPDKDDANGDSIADEGWVDCGWVDPDEDMG
jgi:hypothetical protein